jgi:hypothetical protein
LRRWGAHLDMQIVYSNMWANLCSWFSPGPVKYTYQLQHVPVLEGVRTIRTRQASPYLPYLGPPEVETRVVRRTYGIRIHYEQSGLLGIVTRTSVLGFLIGSITLLSIPWTISELFVSLSVFSSPELYKEVVIDAPSASVTKKNQ